MPATVAEEVEVGKTYDFRLGTHCGIEWARIDGAWWRTKPLNRGGNPPAGWDNPSHKGRLSITSTETATFSGGPDGPIEFHRTDSKPSSMCL